METQALSSDGEEVIKRLHLKHNNTHSKTCLKRSFKKNTKIGFQYKLSLNAGEKYCRSKGSILQYFRPSLSYHFPLRPWFCPLSVGRLRQVFQTILIEYAQIIHIYLPLTYQEKLEVISLSEHSSTSILHMHMRRLA